MIFTVFSGDTIFCRHCTGKQDLRGKIWVEISTFGFSGSGYNSVCRKAEKNMAVHVLICNIAARF